MFNTFKHGDYSFKERKNMVLIKCLSTKESMEVPSEALAMFVSNALQREEKKHKVKITFKKTA